MLYTVKSAVEGKDYFFREKQITSSSLTEITETEKKYLETVDAFKFIFEPVEQKEAFDDDNGEQSIDEEDISEKPAEEDPSEEFPKMISRGNYQLSNGESFAGNKNDAIKAEKALEK
ncbi:hypothetical protein ABQD97_16005 [Enterococcus avium]|jgi:hypothetical protein|uniref:Uncharacterized protein n=1 Tax=Siphoviridae sp. ctJhT5 TaxID=2826242 RepID=A0A8S5QZV9_9CAUD|nr:MAG TPA: hypothetical protein [Siphoviridae sp. ctJhT5]